MKIISFSIALFFVGITYSQQYNFKIDSVFTITPKSRFYFPKDSAVIFEKLRNKQLSKQDSLYLTQDVINPKLSISNIDNMPLAILQGNTDNMPVATAPNGNYKLLIKEPFVNKEIFPKNRKKK